VVGHVVEREAPQRMPQNRQGDQGMNLQRHHPSLQLRQPRRPHRPMDLGVPASVAVRGQSKGQAVEMFLR